MDDDIDFQEINMKDDDMTMFWIIILFVPRHKEKLTHHSALDPSTSPLPLEVPTPKKYMLVLYLNNTGMVRKRTIDRPIQPNTY